MKTKMVHSEGILGGLCTSEYNVTWEKSMFWKVVLKRLGRKLENQVWKNQGALTDIGSIS